MGKNKTDAKTDAKTEIEILAFNDKKYYLDSVSQEAKAIIQNIQNIDFELNKMQLMYNTITLGKNSLLNTLKDLSKDFEDISGNSEKQ